MKNIDEQYKLIPMDEITPEARRIAVAWIDNYVPHGSLMPEIAQKQKLASDIMNYASLQCAEMKKELERLRLKWEDKLALHRRVCADPLMYTKEDRLKNSHYAQAIAAFLSDLKSLYNKETINHDTINKP